MGLEYQLELIARVCDALGDYVSVVEEHCGWDTLDRVRIVHGAIRIADDLRSRRDLAQSFILIVAAMRD